MGAFQGRALKLETACKVTFPLKCHVFLEKSFFHLKNAFCHQAVSAPLPTDSLKQELLEKLENHIWVHDKQIKAKKRSLGSTFPSGEVCCSPSTFSLGGGGKKNVHPSLGSLAFRLSSSTPMHHPSAVHAAPFRALKTPHSAQKGIWLLGSLFQ